MSKIVAVDSENTVNINHISDQIFPMQEVSTALSESNIENLMRTISKLAPYSGEEFRVEGPVSVNEEVPPSALMEINNNIVHEYFSKCDDDMHDVGSPKQTDNHSNPVVNGNIYYLKFSIR